MKITIPLPKVINAQKELLNRIKRKIKVIYKFPHIPRIINATLLRKLLNLIIIFFLLFLIILNIWFNYSNKNNQEITLRNKIMEYPFDFRSHEELGKYYLKENLQFSEKEYQLAELFYSKESPVSDQVLGVTSSPWQTWLNIINFKENTFKDINYWKSFNDKYPDYKFGYLKQAYGYFQIGNKEKSMELIMKILDINPIDQNANILLNKLKNG
jgi:tetratricopeptide (TPR) repeat protein